MNVSHHSPLLPVAKSAFAACFVVVVLSLIACVGLANEDTVVISRGDGPGQARRTGEIVDFTGEFLTLQLAGGRQEKIPAERVLGVETSRVKDHQNADQLVLEGRYPDAVVAYRRAANEESRTWVRRQILASLVRCYTNMNQPDLAGDTFLLILRSDPTSPWFDTIPLAWMPQPPAGSWEQRAADWMDNPTVPAAALMGASWLLSTARRDQALDVLRRLAADPDSRVALLAEAQQWRVRLVTASAEDVARWESVIGRLDRSLRAGPYFLLGHAQARQSEPVRAALAFLRVPILYPEHRDLAAESLLMAGEQLTLAGSRDGAATLFRELIDKHPDHVLAAVAEQKLREGPAQQ
jgi:tetratricopeptide (TPR) repeat protein